MQIVEENPEDMVSALVEWHGPLGAAKEDQWKTAKRTNGKPKRGTMENRKVAKIIKVTVRSH